MLPPIQEAPRPTSAFTLGTALRLLPPLAMAGVLLAVSQTVKMREPASARYRECSALAAKDPAKALRQAHAWRQNDPDSPVAGHCEAIALYASGDYPRAAIMLEALTRDAAGRHSILTGDLALQAAAAENAAGHDDQALFMLSFALSQPPSTVSNGDKALLLIERAKLYRAMGRPLLAVQDLDNVLTLAPGNADAKALLAEMAQKTAVPAAPVPDAKKVK